jgi:SAM-dependent methyltransferase
MDAWRYARWGALKLSSLLLYRIRGRNRSTETTVIRWGNRLFPDSYPTKLYDDYATYIRMYPPSLKPFEELMPKERWLTGRTVLDLGSGLGQYSALLRDEGAARVYGLEYQYEKALWAHERYASPALRFVAGSGETLPFEADTFDAIFSNTVFEHIPDVESALLSMARVLKPDGAILLSYNFIHHRGGHHLFPYIQFPWAPWVVSEKTLCDYWSDRLAEDQAKGRMGFYPKGCRVRSLSEGNEIHLNRLNYEQFEAGIQKAGLRIRKRVTSEMIGRMLPFLLNVPGLKYFLTGTVFYVLERADRSAASAGAGERQTEEAPCAA